MALNMDEETVPADPVNSIEIDLRTGLSLFQNALSTDEASNHLEEILDQIRKIDQMEYSSATFDLIQWIFRSYIQDILPMNSTSEEILSSLSSLKINFHLQSLFEKDGNFARHVFFSSFNLLASPIMIDYFEGKLVDNRLNQLEVSLRLIFNRIQQALEWIQFETNDLNEQESILRILLKHVHISIEYEHPIVKDIFHLLLSLTGNTILVPNFINAGCVTYILQWLELDQLTFETQRSCVHIFYNLAQKTEGAKALNQADGLRILKDCTNRLLDPDTIHGQYGFENTQLLYCMALSLLIEPKENREYVKTHRQSLDYLLQAAIDASLMADCHYAGFHVSRPIVVLTKLFVQDEILKYVLNEASVKNLSHSSKISFFVTLLIRFRGASTTDEDENNLLTLTALFNILWSISFHHEYRSELQMDPKFLLTVKTFAHDNSEITTEQQVYTHMSPILKAANGILLNLGESINVRPPDSAGLSGKMLGPATAVSPRIKVMVSYSHADADFCQELVAALQKDPRLDIWVDFIFCHSGDLWEEISEAIENAHVILLLITKEYQSSKSCRQEVMYARDTLKKRFIPIYLKKDFIASSWLGIRIVGPQYIRFGKRSFGDTITEVLNLIVDDGSSHKQRQEENTRSKMPGTLLTNTFEFHEVIPEKRIEENPLRSMGSHSSKSGMKLIEQWTVHDLDRWFDENMIETKLRDLYRFQYASDLLLYAQCLHPDWQHEYADMRERYMREYNQILYRDQFVRWVGALFRLRNRH